MENGNTDWQEWHKFFRGRSQRPLPAAEPLRKYRNLPPSLAASLAIF